MTSIKFKNLCFDGEIGHIIKEELTDEFCDSFVLAGEEETCLPVYYLQVAEEIKNFEIRNNDIFIASYPKAGTTWTQEMIWLITNNLDFEGAKQSLRKRFPFLEGSILADKEKLVKVYQNLGFEECSVNHVKNLKSPRYVKTHLPFSLLPDDLRSGIKCPKLIYVVRNPKDVCVSYCHHGNLLQGWNTNVENFAKVFLADKAIYGSFWKHALGFWEHRNRPNFLFIAYEDMKNDLPSVVKKVAHFLEKSLTDEELKLLCKHLSFESMKNNESLNWEDFVTIKRKHNIINSDGKFMRSGIVGKFKEEMCPKTIKQFDSWIKENTAGTSFHEYANYLQ